MLPPSFETLLLVSIGVCVLGAVGCFLVAFPRAMRARSRERAEALEGGAEPDTELLAPPRRRAARVEATLEVGPEPERAAVSAFEEQPLQVEVAIEPPAPPPVPVPRKPDLKRGLRNSRVAFVGRLERLLRGRGALDAETLEEVEAILFGADLGVRTADQLLEAARGAGSPERVTAVLEERALEQLRALPSPVVPLASPPHVILVVGVNGSGKTTSIGKLAHRYRSEGKSVMVAAGDTYRAAAIEQLGVWAERAGADIVKGSPGGDPASVAFDAVKAAKGREVDVVIIDTAGRLQTDKDLMDQLAKIQRVVQKEVPSGPHEVILVLDGNTGQNAIRQAQEFSRSVDVSSILLSKLDGTAKGGVVLGIAQEVGIPVRYVGMGEGMEDLYDFDPEAFAHALFAPTDSDEAAAG